MPCPERLPSCVNQQDGDQPINDKMWKSNYVVCDKERTVSKNNCTTGYFHPELKRCMEIVLRRKSCNEIHVMSVLLFLIESDKME